MTTLENTQEQTEVQQPQVPQTMDDFFVLALKAVYGQDYDLTGQIESKKVFDDTMTYVGSIISIIGNKLFSPEQKEKFDITFINRISNLEEVPQSRIRISLESLTNEEVAEQEALAAAQQAQAQNANLTPEQEAGMLGGQAQNNDSIDAEVVAE